MDGFFFNSEPISWFQESKVSVFQTSFRSEKYSEELVTKLDADYLEFVRNSVNKRKAEFFAGRYCAHQSLNMWNANVELIRIGTDRSPQWPKHSVGSISHCNAFAIAATASSELYLSIGLDAEDIVEDGVRNGLLHNIVNSDELRLIEGSREPNAIFTLMFSMKESFFKAVYPLIKKYIDFTAVSIKEIDEVQNKIRFTINQHIGDNFVPGLHFTGHFSMKDNRKVITFFKIERKR